MSKAGREVGTGAGGLRNGAAIAGMMAGMMIGGAEARAEPPSWPSYDAPSLPPLASFASATPAVRGNHHAAGVDTEHIFGFSMGSDIGEPGEIEVEMENVAAVGKRSGSYAALATLNQVKYTLTDRFRIAPGFALGGQRIDGVAGFDNRSHLTINGAGLEFRAKLVDRDTAPLGLTLHAQPNWSRVDEGSGVRIEQYGGEFAALIDRVLIKDRLFAAFNVWYGTAVRRELAGTPWDHDSELQLHGALSYAVTPSIVFGGGLRYLRAYDGGGLDRLRGQAVYLGPTFSWNITGTVGISGTWQMQIAGNGEGAGYALNLDRYERHQAMLRLNAHF